MRERQRPKVILLMDESEASREALRRFSECDVDLTAVAGCSGYMLPSASMGNVVYGDRWGIEFLATRLPKKELEETETIKQ